MPLQSAIDFFTRESRSLGCMSIACGNAERALCAEGGAMDPSGRPVAADSIFDIASLTKLFTACLAMRLREEGKLNLNAPVGRYTDRFPLVQTWAVGDILTYRTGIRTPERIDAQPDRGAALAMLFAAAPVPNGPRAYSDMHAMVMKYVIEGAADTGFMDALRARVLRPLGLNETTAGVAEADRGRCVSCDGEHRIERGVYTLRHTPPGTPHDPKAAILQTEGDCAGHAGLFSTRRDLIRLCQGLLRGELLRRDTLRWMAINRTGRVLPGGGHSQYLGCLVYVKHPDQYFSEVPEQMTEEALALSGFTGCHLAVDPARGLFEFYLGSRVMQRLSVCTPCEGETWTDFGLNPDGTGEIRWPDGSRVISSVNYVHLKDAHYHRELPIWDAAW